MGINLVRTKLLAFAMGNFRGLLVHFTQLHQRYFPQRIDFSGDHLVYGDFGWIGQYQVLLGCIIITWIDSTCLS